MTDMADVISEKLAKIGRDGFTSHWLDMSRGELSGRLAEELTAAGFGDLREAQAQALQDAADAALDRVHGLDGNLIREAENRGFMQRHNVTSAARWLRTRAAVLRGQG